MDMRVIAEGMGGQMKEGNWGGRSEGWERGGVRDRVRKG